MSAISGKKRKLLIITSFTLPNTAGSGIHAFRFARFINRQGDKATILTFNRNLKFKLSEIIDNVPIIRIPYFNRSFVLKLLSLPVIFFCILVYILKNNVVIIYGGKTIGYEFGILLAKAFCKKVVFQSLLYGVDDINNLLNKNKTCVKFNRKLFSLVDCYFAINQEFSKQYSKIFSNQKKLLESPQGVDISVFKPSSNKIKLRKSLNLPINTYLIISVGFVIPRKGFADIFNFIKDLNFKYHLLILGEYNIDRNHFLASQREEMKLLFQQGSSLLGKNITFLGFQKNIDQYLKCADVFILNSLQEGLPNVLLEAMACEIPIIVRKIVGVDGFLTKHMKNSLVFQSSGEITNQLEYTHSNPEKSKEIALAAKNDVVNNYSFEHIYFKMLEKINA